MTLDAVDQLRRLRNEQRRNSVLFRVFAVGSVIAIGASLLFEQRLSWLMAITIMVMLMGAVLRHRMAQQTRHNITQWEALLQAQQRQANQQEAWRRMRELLQRDLDEDAFLRALLDTSAEVLGAERASLWFLDKDRSLTCRMSLVEALNGIRLAPSGLDGYLASLTQNPCLVTSDAQHDERLSGLHHYLCNNRIHAMLDVGIFVGGELRGAICCESTTPREWHGDEITTLMGFAGLLSQFSESLRRREVEHDLYRQLYHDEVSGLATLRGLLERLQALTQRDEAFHLLVLRLGGLGHINETLGQQAGDEAIRQVAEKLQERLTELQGSIHVGRLPANRLLIAIPGQTDESLRRYCLARLLSLGDNSWRIFGTPSQLRFNAGVARYPLDAQDIESLLQRAELAVQHARETPPPHLAFYTSQLSDWEQRLNRLARELRTALDERQFRLYLQGQFDPAGRLTGAEVLLRWQHPREGLLAPGSFIAEAEYSGLIRPMGQWVLDQACDLLGGALHGSELSLSVNVSVQQLHDDAFITHLTQLLERHAFEPRRLILEVVESLLVTPGVAARLNALRALGVRLALDDFGTGYSSLRYLQDFRVDEIKIDKVFVDAITPRCDAPLVRSIIALGKALELRVVAEGVENSAQQDYLCARGIDFLQGYYLALPEPMDAFLRRLEKTLPE
ncbi:putative bifunctional diguanylate cyclase/phosphodiesterase [Chromohalobacter nigrandesensis]|uniref:putative bifunctional diguanylate cyclase/phosphodiesterase n=1 Tax=Chromohalobacter nigrandesensis TaxID=119863 RepID=UPI001FF6F7A4|nr:sensor domain-containing phosphodiesterase [Chromohalobacter nigrandesensis]MCK0745700.1 sensor domain-containing phosphodiesterase [Chromohalobacter nigrandesensis]